MYIETRELKFRPLDFDDFSSFQLLLHNPHVRKFLLDDELMPSEWILEEIQASKENFSSYGVGLFLVFEAKAEAAIGFCGFRHFDFPGGFQLLFALLPEFCGRGFATQMALVLSDLALNRLSKSEIFAGADIPNLASHRVLAKIGMEPFVCSVGETRSVYYRLQSSSLKIRPEYIECQSSIEFE